MSLAELCVKRGVFAVMLIAFLVVLGLFSFRDLTDRRHRHHPHPIDTGGDRHRSARSLNTPSASTR